MRKNDSFTYFNFLILCMWLQDINTVKVTHEGQGYIHQGQSKISTSLQILCSPYSLQAGGLHSTEMLLVLQLIFDLISFLWLGWNNFNFISFILMTYIF